MNNPLKRLLVLLTCFLPWAMPVLAQGPESSPGGRTEAALLEQQYAEARSQQLANVAYKLFFDLTGGGDEYSGRVEARFDLLHGESPLSVDFTAGEVKSVSINGNAWPDNSGTAH